MYNHYLYDDRDAFEDLYVDVSAPKPEESEPEPPKSDAPSPDAQPAPKVQQHGGGGLSALLARFGHGENNFVPLLILAFLMLDAEEDERIIILALALLLGL